MLPTETIYQFLCDQFDQGRDLTQSQIATECGIELNTVRLSILSLRTEGRLYKQSLIPVNRVAAAGAPMPALPPQTRRRDKVEVKPPKVNRGKTQQAILDFIAAHIREKHVAPSVREIADGVGLASTSTVNHHLKQLASKGRIGRLDNIARGIYVVADSDSAAV